MKKLIFIFIAFVCSVSSISAAYWRYEGGNCVSYTDYYSNFVTMYNLKNNQLIILTNISPYGACIPKKETTYYMTCIISFDDSTELQSLDDFKVVSIKDKDGSYLRIVFDDYDRTLLNLLKKNNTMCIYYGNGEVTKLIVPLKGVTAACKKVRITK